MLRAVIFTVSLLTTPVGLAAPPVPASSAAPRADEHSLRDTQRQLQEQRAQSAQLKSRVDELERRSAAAREQQAQRDREIAELQRKLDAVQGHGASAPAAARSGAGHR